MPLYKNIKSEKYSEAAIWHITEPEHFFSDQLGFSTQKKLEKRRLEFLATRLLLQQTIPGFPFEKMAIAATGKPFLHGTPYHFSISHSFPYVAVAFSERSVGIDVQVFQPKISRLKDKFLSVAEQKWFADSMEKLTLAWTAKEAAYKRLEKNGVDFIRDLSIRDFHMQGNAAFFEMECFRNADTGSILTLNGQLENGFAWTVTQ